MSALDRSKHSKDAKTKESETKTETVIIREKESGQKEAIEKLQSKIEEYSKKESENEKLQADWQKSKFAPMKEIEAKKMIE